MINVIKIGGNIVDNDALLQQFVKDFAAVPGPKVLVHGGGVMASRLQKQMGLTPKMINGRRVTDEETLCIVTMVYGGWCGKHITSLLQAESCNAISLSGCDGNVICGSKRPAEPVDYGFAGDLNEKSVNADFLLVLLNQGITPVINAITHDKNGNLLNTNADTIASTVAVALAQKTPTELTFCFEKDGVLYDMEDDSSVIATITPADFELLKSEGRVADGMLPKLTNAFTAINQGVSSVIIKHARNINLSYGTVICSHS